MKKLALSTVFVLLLASLLLLSSCQLLQISPGMNNGTGAEKPLFNESANQEIENLTNTTNLPEFKEFYFNYTPRNESKYEIARDDVFMLSNGSFNSSEISFLGVMLGDSYESVLARLGIPDMIYIPADKISKNLDYRERIGIGGTNPGLTIHIENDTVTRITVKPPFNKYLQGNTSLGQTKEFIYYKLDVPEYQSFLDYLRVFHYVEKGVELYFKNIYVERMSFIPPKTFKGVVYVTQPQLLKEGVMANVTVPVEIQ